MLEQACELWDVDSLHESTCYRIVKHCEDHSPAGTKELEVLKPKSVAPSLVRF